MTSPLFRILRASSRIRPALVDDSGLRDTCRRVRRGRSTPAGAGVSPAPASSIPVNLVIVWIGRWRLVIYEILRPMDCPDHVEGPRCLSVVEKTAQVVG